ncbi:hypothetical protein DSO57_1026034 [Entomophthora muscae]|uniref:Uncharacterized protein n=1 Tax=Entomophthora muscae TaxID=34485 RepID=A0ACC2SF56_9FUNG|nr:hypothetical protein DSO57_1026034 [Entomophthora muscae]
METPGKKRAGDLSNLGSQTSSGSKLVQLSRGQENGINGTTQRSNPNAGSISNSGNTRSPESSPNSEIHPLHFTWVFWFMHRPPGQKIASYESAMKRIAAFSSIEDFWAVYSHLRRPHDLPTISDYHLFKQGVRPVWEDEANINGGKWIIRIKKGLASRYWEKSS